MKKYDKLSLFVISLSSIIIIADFEIAPDLLAWRVHGYLIIVFGMTILLEAFVIKNRIIAGIGYIMSFIGYILSFIYIYNHITISSNHESSELVIALYVISFLALSVSLFFKMNTKKKSGSFEKDVENIEDDKFILANMILGFKNIPYGETVLVKIDNNSILFKKRTDELLGQYQISNIKNIEFTRKLNSNSKRSHIKENAALQHYSRSAVVGDNIGMAVAENKFDNAEIMSNYRLGSLYELDILIQDNNKEKKIKMETGENPTKFVNFIKESINKNN